MQICKLISAKEKIAITDHILCIVRSIAVGSIFTKRTLNFLVCALVETHHVILKTFLGKTMSYLPVHSHPLSYFFSVFSCRPDESDEKWSSQTKLFEN